MTDRRRVLVSAPSRAMRTAARVALADFRVVEATEEITTTGLAASCRPAAIVIDATDPSHAVRIIEVLRRDVRTVLTPTVYIVDEAPVEGMVSGAFRGSDDYVVCPFDGAELADRVNVCLRRSTVQRGVSPLTGLPGNTSVAEEIVSRADDGAPFACVYIDIDDFKAFNDRFGFARGDDVIRSLASCITQVLETRSPGECFAGHVGGDDFVVLTPTDAAAEVAERIIVCFEADGCRLSIGLVMDARGLGGPVEVAEAAAAAKRAAKENPRSSWAKISGPRSRS